jgi:transmembrane sensor
MNDDLLVKYLVGESTEQESAFVEQWIAADEENRKYFEQYKWVWEESRHLEPPGAPSETEAWERFKLVRIRKENDRARVITLRTRFPMWQQIAAVLLILISGSLLYYFLTNRTTSESGNLVTLFSKGQVISDTLSDGSIVTLNKKSSLSYPAAFSGRNRSVEMEGEAFFNIAHDKNKPFVIHTGGLDIKVVGTSFNVKISGGETSVIVETGIVEVSRNKEVIRLNPNEMAIASGKNEKMVIEKSTDNLYNYYRTNEFVCNSTPLWKLVDVLNEAYDAHIRIESENLKDLPLTTTFNEESLENILKIITETFGIRMENRNGEIILR